MSLFVKHSGLDPFIETFLGSPMMSASENKV